jgi:O-antigen/teichoic acid export membrane protein
VLGSAATGAYGAAYRLFYVLQFLPSIYVDSAFRTMSDLAHRERERFARLVERSAALMFIVGLGLAAGGVPLAGRIITAVFGSGFDASTAAFRALLVSLPVSFAMWIVLSALMTGDRPQTAATLVAISVVGNLVANILLVRRYGIEASAWITVATDMATTVMATRMLAARGIPVHWLRGALLGVPPAVLAAAAVLALRGLPLALAIAGGAVAWAVGVLLIDVPGRLGLGALRPALASRWRSAARATR